MRTSHRIFQALSAIAWLVLPSGASAHTINNISVDGVGIQSINVYTVLSVVPPGCPSNVVYHPSEGLVGQHVMSVLLTARASRLPITRLDYTMASTGTCWIELVQI